MRPGRSWIFGDDVDTDQLAPGAFMKSSLEELASHCLERLNPDFAKQVQSGDIVVGGINFGCGSSRNGSAPLKILGVSVVLAESIARIHLRNAVNTGLPTLVAPGITELVEEGQTLEVNITSGEVKNMETGASMVAQAWAEGTPPYDILMAGGLDAYMDEKLRARGLK